MMNDEEMFRSKQLVTFRKNEIQALSEELFQKYEWKIDERASLGEEFIYRMRQMSARNATLIENLREEFKNENI